MPQTIEFEGVEHEFPDDATDDEISNALSALDQPQGVTATTGNTPSAGPADAISAPATSNPIADAARRVGAGIAEAATTAAAGLTRMNEAVSGGVLGFMGEPVREFLRDVQERAREDYGVDPARDKELVSKVIGGATSLLPIIASGPAAPLTAAGLMGESVRQEAEAKGATEGQKAAAFAGGATIGVVSEALLGIPALLRSAKASGATDAVLKSITRQAVEQGLKNTVREASQEAIEQVSTNLLANTVVGYDPERKTSEGVLEAAGLGAIIGGPVGAAVQVAASLDAKTIDGGIEQLKQEAESVADPDTQVAPPTTTVETPGAPGIAGEKGAPADAPAPPSWHEMPDRPYNERSFVHKGDAGTPDAPIESAGQFFFKKNGFWNLSNDGKSWTRMTDPRTSSRIEDWYNTAAERTPAVEPAPSTVGEHLKTDKAVQAILDEQPSTPEAATMKAPEIPTEGGAAGGTGGKRTPPPKAIGDTPRGDKNWLRIPPWFKRVGKGLFTEGARHVLGRTNNQVGKALAKATRRHVDVEQELFGQHEKILRDAVSSIPKNRQDALWAEVSQYVRDAENGRPTTPLAADAQRVLDAWYDVGRSTGDIARANNVQVWDANLGAYRPMGTVTNYIPRMFSREVEAALRDPEKNPSLFNNLAQAIATHRGIALDAAAKELNKVAGRFSSNDFHGNLELARLEQLPEIFYEYDLRNLATRYLPAFSERMGQIIAYGQRLGPRESPSRMNLWDIARREARDETTQQWLNAAEDQATGFRPKNEFERNARRLQAIGNATLLSDPTTTVVRNLLSGLSVTAERFGVARAFKSLREASRAAAGLDAREIGALRDDIGSFLGAEQLGDSALDNAIRGAQQKALKIAGFSGSENFVRRHGAMTASAFARDAANALATNPTSRLAKEALRYFKSLDVDAEAIVTEGGNWKTGPETRKFIRSSLRESQGGYRFDQVPIWAGSTVGRFLYQYGRWGIQRAGDIFRNTIRPAIGETVEFRGKKMTHRNVMPLMRLGMLTVGLGEGFAAIAATLFGRDRRDASLSEIGEALDDDEQQAVALMGERIINDVLMAGTLGLIGQPVDYFKALKDQTRLKNPLDPPSIAGVKTVVDLATKAKDQGGTLTKRDLLDAAASMARGPKNVTDVARNAVDEKLYEAQNDQRTLRNSARRWAKTQGMDVSSKISFDTVRKSLNAPVFEAINDALLVGDAEKARQLRDEFVNSKKTSAEKKKASEAVKASAEGRHPFRAGPFTSDKYRKQFMEWAEKNLGADDREQIQRVIKTYDDSVKASGL